MLQNKGYKITVVTLLIGIVTLSIMRQGYDYDHYEYYSVVFHRLSIDNTFHYIQYSQLTIYILPIFSFVLLFKRIVNGISNFTFLEGKLNTIISSIVIVALIILLIGVEDYSSPLGNIHNINYLEGSALLSIVINLLVIIFTLVEARKNNNKSLQASSILAIVTVLMAIYLSAYKLYWFILFLFFITIVITSIMLVVDKKVSNVKTAEEKLDYI